MQTPTDSLGAALRHAELDPDATRERSLVWQDPVATFERAAKLSGLEYLEAILHGSLPPAPFMVLLRMAPRKAVYGEIVTEATPGEEHYTVSGAVYGGYAATLLDAVMGSAILTTAAAGEAAPTQSLEVKMIRPLTRDTGTVIAHGRVVHRGRRQATAEGSLVAAGSGKLLASGTTTCMIIG